MPDLLQRKDNRSRGDVILPATQDQILARFVKDGICVLKDNTMVAVVRVFPTDLSLMSADERQAKVMQYEDVLRGIRFPYQIIVGTEPQSLERYLKHLESCADSYQERRSAHLADLAMEHALFVRGLSRRANAQVRYFLIALTHEDALMVARRATGRLPELSADQIDTGQRELSQRSSHFMLALQRIGLESRRLDDRELTAELANFYHPQLPRQAEVSEEFFVTSLLNAQFGETAGAGASMSEPGEHETH